MENKTLNTLKKGHLYWNAKFARVERVLAQEHGNVTHRHHGETNVSCVTFFRLATREEVGAYLGK